MNTIATLRPDPGPRLSEAPHPAPDGPHWLPEGWLAVPLLMLAVAVVCRGMGFLFTVIDTDEGLYYVQAQQWLQGGWPLVAVWDMHPVGAPAMYSLAFTLFGESVAAIRVLGILCTAATGTALFALVRFAGGPRMLALGAGVLTIGYTVVLYGLATNTEVLFGPFVAAAMAIGVRGLIRANDIGAPPRWGELLLMGGLLGCGLAIKPVVVPEGCLAFACLTLPALWQRVLSPLRFLAMALVYALLCLLPTATFGLAYALRGEFAAFIDGSFLAPMRYSMDRLTLFGALPRIQTATLILLTPLLLGGFGLLRWVTQPGSTGRLARIALAWLLAAVLAIMGPGFFYQHYFLILLPPLSVLAALGAWQVATLARPGLVPAVFAGLIALAAAEAWRQEASVRLERGLWLPDPVAEVAKALNARLKPGEAIFIVNYHPVVYGLTHAALPTRFVFPAHLTGNFTDVSDVDTEAELHRVLASKPRFIVVDRGWWPQVGPQAETMLNEVLPRDYEIVLEIPEERGPVELWQVK